jgi:protein SCO1/2
MTGLAIALALGLAAAAEQPNRMQSTPYAGGYITPGTPSSSVPELLSRVGIDQKLGSQVPLDLPFTDETGRSVKLGDYFGSRPVVLTLVYYECPMLCTQVLNGAVSAFKTLNFTVGQEFDVLTISFNPKDTTALAGRKKTTYIAKYGRPQAASGWHFLTGAQTSIDALAKSVGFRYVFDAATQQYVHASAIMILTPQGRVSKYFYGIEYAPRDIRLGLIEASNGKIGNPVDQVLLYCYHYDPSAGTYSMVVMNVLRLGGLATIVIIGGSIAVMLSRERRKPKSVVT